MDECVRGHLQASTDDHVTLPTENNFRLTRSPSKSETLENSFNLWSFLINTQNRKQASETFQYKPNIRSIQQASLTESHCSKLDQFQSVHEQQSSLSMNTNSYSPNTPSCHSIYSNLSCSREFHRSEMNDNEQEFINRVDPTIGLDAELSNGSSNGTLDVTNDDSSNTSSAYDGAIMSTERLISGLDVIINGGECSPCSWCRGTSPKMFTLRTAAGLKTFCSETCFAQCRRSSFKKNKVCDWCKHIRHTVNYVDFQDGSQQLQFCSDKCLNQYKMNVFCRETQAHINALHSQLNLPLRSSSNGLSLANSSQIETDSLITPESWLRGSRSEHSESTKSIDSMRIQPSDQCKSKSSHKENEHASGKTISADKSIRITHSIGNQKFSKSNHSKKVSPDHVIDFSTKNQTVKRPEQRKDYEENVEHSFLSNHHKGNTSNSSYDIERFTDKRSTEFHHSAPKSIFPPIFPSNFDSKTFSHCFPPLYPPPPPHSHPHPHPQPPPSGEARLSANSFMNSSTFTPISDRFSASDLPFFRHHHGLLPPPPFIPLRSPLPNMMHSSITEMNPMINTSLPARNSLSIHAQAINDKICNTSLMTADENLFQKCFPLMPIPFPLPLPLPIPFPIPYNRSTSPNHLHHQATQTSYDDPEESLKSGKSSKKIDPELKAQVNSLMNKLIHQNTSFSGESSLKNVGENNGQAKASNKSDRIEQSNGKRKHEDETQKFQQQFEKLQNNNEFSPNSQSILSRDMNSSQSNKRIKKDLTVA